MESSKSSQATLKMVARMQQEQRQRLLQSSSTTTQKKATMSRQEESVKKAAEIQVEDNISKKIADIRMHPYVETQEIREAEAATLRARARIIDLERELEDITKKAIMTSTK